MTNLKFNVAQLLREEIGARRNYTFQNEQLRLDETLVARQLGGKVQFTRTASGVFVQVRASGLVRMVCVRSLEEFDQPIALDMADEFHSVIDVVSAEPQPEPTEEDPFFLDTFHMADIGEYIREYALLELPLNPVCEAWRQHPIRYTVQSEGLKAPSFEDDEEEAIDARLEVLKKWRKA